MQPRQRRPLALSLALVSMLGASLAPALAAEPTADTPPAESVERSTLPEEEEEEEEDSALPEEEEPDAVPEGPDQRTALDGEEPGTVPNAGEGAPFVREEMEAEPSEREVEATPEEPPTADALQLVVHKRNDANRDGTFSDLEEVSGAGAAVPFRVGIRNLSETPLTVVAVTDTIGDTTLDLLEEPYCSQLATTLPPAGHLSCTFTLDRYLRTFADPPRDELTNVVHVVAAHGEDVVTAEDASTVVNPNAGRVSVEVIKTNDADGDGNFTDVEVAPAAGAAVTFQVVVRNTSPGTAQLVSLTDTWPGLAEPIDLLELCPALEAIKLRGAGGGHDDDGGSGGCGDDHGDDDHGDDDHGDDGGCGDDHEGGCGDEHGDDGGGNDHDGGCGGGKRSNTITCTFTLEGYAPPSGTSVSNTVTAILAKPHDPEVSATATASATVSTPAAPEPEPEPTRPAPTPEPEPKPAPTNPPPTPGPMPPTPATPETAVLGDVLTSQTGGTRPLPAPTGRALPATGAGLAAMLLAAALSVGTGSRLLRRRD
jgi:hypothetical protein